jgi:hypothetical protein
LFDIPVGWHARALDHILDGAAPPEGQAERTIVAFVMLLPMAIQPQGRSFSRSLISPGIDLG